MATTSKGNGLFNHPAAGGVLLALSAVAALLVVNSPFAPYYEAFFKTPIVVIVGPLEINKPLLLWVNDLLMAVFFFLVGLEIKRELLEGELSSFDRAMLPLFGAIGGMAVPAAIYVGINWETPQFMNGWAIPAATDIAFTIGMMALLGTRVPVSVKVFVTALAIIDDLGAILIIAFFYTSNLSTTSLIVAAVGTVILAIMNRAGVRGIAPYMLVGLAMWIAVLKSGVHATLAGVIIAMFIPITRDEKGHSPLLQLEHDLKNPVNLAILPLFGLGNAGISFAGMSFADFLEPVTLGIAAGLFIGKPVGIVILAWIAITIGIARMPKGSTWQHIVGGAALCGIGFTMSLFIGGLAFPQPDMQAAVRLGVLTGSIASAILGWALLAGAPREVLAPKPATA